MLQRVSAVATTIVVGLMLVPAASAQPPAVADASGTARIRVVAANVSSGNFQSYPNPGPGMRLLQALRPDVVLIQELRIRNLRDDPDDEPALRAWVDQVFGPEFHVFREPAARGDIPNGVISRWPILEAGEWRDPVIGNRDFAFARIDVPGPVDLWAVSVHLSNGSLSKRTTEAETLVERILATVPEDDFLVFGGDLNTRRVDERPLEILSRIVDVEPPHPDDGADPPDGDTNSNRNKPYDWVLVDPVLEILAVDTVFVDPSGNELRFPAGLVFDTRVFDDLELEDFFPPALRIDSEPRLDGRQTQMQHMAVVRDFLIPAGELPADPNLDP